MLESKKKLAVLINSFSGGGGERVAANFLEQLSLEYKIHLFFLSENIKYSIPENVTIHYLSKKNRNNFLNIILIPFFAYRYYSNIKRLGITQSISFLERSNFINCFLKVLKWKGKVIISLQGSMTGFYPTSTFKGKVGRFLIAKLYPQSNIIIPCSKWLEQEFQTEFKVKNNNFKQIYNPLNQQLIDKQLIGIAKEERNFLRFIHVGSFLEVKNHDLLIRSFAKAFKNSTSKLTLVGDGPLVANIEQLIKELQMENQIELIGFTNNPFAYLYNADVLVLSSKTEGLPNVILEAMYCGLAIISTDCRSGPREIMAPNTSFNYQLKNGIELTDIGILTTVNDIQSLVHAFNLIAENDGINLDLCKKNANKAVKSFYLKNICQNLKQYLD